MEKSGDNNPTLSYSYAANEMTAKSGCAKNLSRVAQVIPKMRYV
jgi:hypothetical protein